MKPLAIATRALHGLLIIISCAATGSLHTIELNEAFAAQGLAVLRDLGLADDARVNSNGDRFD